MDQSFENVLTTDVDGLRFGSLFMSAQEDTSPLERVVGAIRELRLERYAWELDALGYTVVPPEVAAEPTLALRMREKLLEVAERETGMPIDPDVDGDLANVGTDFGRGIYVDQLVLKAEVFEEALMNRVQLALITYLLGESCVLSNGASIIKAAGNEHLALHSDQVGSPNPLSVYPLSANATWVLSEYSVANGCICFVPGSHKFMRHPTPAESTDPSIWRPIEAPVGSLIVWGGNTWHSALPRKAPGLRLNYLQYFCRWFMLPATMFRDLVRDEQIDRNPDRFAQLMGRNTPYSDPAKMTREVDQFVGQASQYA